MGWIDGGRGVGDHFVVLSGSADPAKEQELVADAFKPNHSDYRRRASAGGPNSPLKSSNCHERNSRGLI